MQAIGMDGMAFLETEDPLYAHIMRVVYAKARLENRKLNRERAILIANQVGGLFKKKGSSG